MLLRLKTLTRSTRLALAQWLRRTPAAAPVADDDMAETEAVFRAPRRPVPLRPLMLTLGTAAVAAGAAYVLIQHPPVQPLEPGHLAVRTNQLTGDTSVWREGPVWAIPGLHQLATLSLQDRSWAAESMATADGASPGLAQSGAGCGPWGSGMTRRTRVPWPGADCRCSRPPSDTTR